MKKKTDDNELVIKALLQNEFEKFGREVDERARGYRDEILTKMDEMMGELEQIREDQAFTRHDIANHEKRITKFELSSKAA